MALVVPQKVDKWIFPCEIAMGHWLLRVLEALLFTEDLQGSPLRSLEGLLSVFV